MQNTKIPKFKIVSEKNDVTTLIRVQQIQNGFVVRGGGSPIHYSTMEQTAEAIKDGLVALNWPVLSTNKEATCQKQ